MCGCVPGGRYDLRPGPGAQRRSGPSCTMSILDWRTPSDRFFHESKALGLPRFSIFLH